MGCWENLYFCLLFLSVLRFSLQNSKKTNLVMQNSIYLNPKDSCFQLVVFFELTMCCNLIWVELPQLQSFVLHIWKLILLLLKCFFCALCSAVKIKTPLYRPLYESSFWCCSFGCKTTVYRKKLTNFGYSKHSKFSEFDNQYWSVSTKSRKLTNFKMRTEKGSVLVVKPIRPVSFTHFF